ncbi:MAG: AMP-binding protein [Acidimicrobiia bacterium]
MTATPTPEPTFNLADLFETVADAVPDRPALVAGPVRLTYRELDERATRFAALLGARLAPGERMTIWARNRAEWVEAMLGAFKSRTVPVNLNYRYTPGEAAHVLADSASRLVVVERVDLPSLAQVVGDLPELRTVVVLEDGTPPVEHPALAGHEVLAAEPALAEAGAAARGPRSSDDLYVLYTGGTTGAPKGVVWRHEDIFFAALATAGKAAPDLRTPADVRDRALHRPATCLPLAPLMHGNAQWNTLGPLLSGSTVVLWTGPFDAEEVWRLAALHGAKLLAIVGDAMALPLADALDADPGRAAGLAGLRVVASGGAIMSPGVKARLHRHLPECRLVDGFGASETGVGGRMVDGTAAGRPRFVPGPGTAVLDAELRPTAPGSGLVGRLARTGHIPLGYLNDPEATARTFVTGPDGTRWALLGDDATVEADGTFTLLGRGSAVINTGGEKVHPEEVELALKAHPAVADALVVGLPDERFGEVVAAVVALRGRDAVDWDELRAQLRRDLSGYKVPRTFAVRDVLERSPAGKPDYRWALRQVEQAREAERS